MAGKLNCSKEPWLLTFPAPDPYTAAIRVQSLIYFDINYLSIMEIANVYK